MKIASAFGVLIAIASGSAHADGNKCERVADPGRLELMVNPRTPERVVDIFWSDPESVSNEYRWDVIAQTLVWGTFSCDDDVDVKDVRRLLGAAGDKCATERAAVIAQLVGGKIKQGVEATWTPTRKLWKCEQRLARKAPKPKPPSRPISKREQCLIDGNPPNVCEGIGKPEPDWGKKEPVHF